MKMIPPFKIENTNLQDSNILEDDYPQWQESESYEQGDKVIVLSTHSVYECVAETSQGNNPTEFADPPIWVRLGPTNKWSCLDGEIATTTTSNNEFTWDGVTYQGIYYALSLQKVVNSLSLFGLNGTKLFFRITDPTDGVVFNLDENLISSEGVTDWYSYFFEPIQFSVDFSNTDLPAYGNAMVEIGIVGTSSDAELSALLLGKSIDLGFVRFGGRFGITDYSRKVRDDFGSPTIQRRGFSKRSNYELRVPKNRVDYVRKMLSQYRSTPVVWQAINELESTLIYGFYKDFDIVFPTLDIFRCNLELEGLNED